MQRRKQLSQDRRGAAIAEYGLIAAIVGATIAVASLALGSAVTEAIAPPQDCAPSQATC
ncbi:MAG: Flp family type IVb pilin [Sphingomicrobium sp.]